MEDPKNPGRFHSSEYKPYPFNTAESLLPAWDRSIPVQDKTRWRDPLIADAIKRRRSPVIQLAQNAVRHRFALLQAHSKTAFILHPDANYGTQTLFCKNAYYQIGKDFCSRPEGVAALQSHLVYAEKVKTLIVPAATHFVHLDRSEHGRSIFLAEVLKFLSE